MMKTLRKTAYKTLVALLVLVFVLSAFSFASASATTYSNVLSDLKSDDTFDETLWSDNPVDYTLKIITIAESDDKELFIYVYQPSDSIKEIEATHINMSLKDPDTIAESSSGGFSLYSLTLISSEGVFDKYVVDNFVVPSTSVRYYNIATIYREFDETIDKSSPNNEINGIGIAVATCYVAESYDDTVGYYSLTTEVVYITSMHVGFLRFYDGAFPLFLAEAFTDSHFVAFSTDRNMEHLTNVKISFNQQSYDFYPDMPEGYQYSYYSKYQETVNISDKERGENKADGLWGVKYTWDCIVSTNSFLKDELVSNQVSADEQKKIKGTEWVVRFFETPFTEVDNYSVHSISGVRVSDVILLELTFLENGELYTLGVVSNKQTGNRNPIGTIGSEKPSILKIIVGLLLLIVLFFFLWPILPYIIKGVWWIITAPFKFIGWLIKACRGKDKGGTS